MKRKYVFESLDEFLKTSNNKLNEYWEEENNYYPNSEEDEPRLVVMLDQSSSMDPRWNERIFRKILNQDTSGIGIVTIVSFDTKILEEMTAGPEELLDSFDMLMANFREPPFDSGGASMTFEEIADFYKENVSHPDDQKLLIVSDGHTVGEPSAIEELANQVDVKWVFPENTENPELLEYFQENGMVETAEY